MINWKYAGIPRSSSGQYGAGHAHRIFRSCYDCACLYLECTGHASGLHDSCLHHALVLFLEKVCLLIANIIPSRIRHYKIFYALLANVYFIFTASCMGMYITTQLFQNSQIFLVISFSSRTNLLSYVLCKLWNGCFKIGYICSFPCLHPLFVSKGKCDSFFE